jgi:hypothetical protein
VRAASRIVPSRSGVERIGELSSPANPHQKFPLAKVALETQALGDLKRRDDASLDLLAALSGSFEVRRSSLRD